jgi:hypothetical protein
VIKATGLADPKGSPAIGSGGFTAQINVTGPGRGRSRPVGGLRATTSVAGGDFRDQPGVVVPQGTGLVGGHYLRTQDVTDTGGRAGGDRVAIVYIRQSTLMHVREHTESTTRRYGLAEEAARLGWPVTDIEVIDADLGRVPTPTSWTPIRMPTS